MKLFNNRFSIIVLLFTIGLMSYFLFSSPAQTNAQISATGLLKVNGSEGPVSVANGTVVTASWTGLPVSTDTSYTCGLSNYRDLNYSIDRLTQRPSGQKTYTVTQAQLLELYCSSASKAPVVDSVEITINSQTPPPPTGDTPSFVLNYKQNGTYIVAPASVTLNSNTQIAVKLTNWVNIDSASCSIAYGTTTNYSVPQGSERIFNSLANSATLTAKCQNPAKTQTVQKTMQVNVSSGPVALTIDGKTSIDIGINNLPKILAWTKNASQTCNIAYLKPSTAVTRQTLVSNVGNSGTISIDSAFFNGDNSVTFYLNCAGTDLANAVVNVNQGKTMKFIVSGIVKKSTGGFAPSRLSGAQICARLATDDKPVCYYPFTNTSGEVILQFNPGTKFLGGNRAYEFTAKKAGYVTAKQTIGGRAFDVGEYTFNLGSPTNASNVVSGTVKTSAGKPVKGAKTVLVKASKTVGSTINQSEVNSSFTTDGIGRYTLPLKKGNSVSAQYQTAVVLPQKPNGVGVNYVVLAVSQPYTFMSPQPKANVIYNPQTVNYITLRFTFKTGKPPRTISGDLVTSTVRYDGQVVATGKGNSLVFPRMWVGATDLMNKKVKVKFTASGYDSHEILKQLNQPPSNIPIVLFKEGTKLRQKILRMGKTYVTGGIAGVIINEVQHDSTIEKIKRKAGEEILRRIQSRSSESSMFDADEHLELNITSDSGRVVYFLPRPSETDNPGVCPAGMDTLNVSFDYIVAAEDNPAILDYPIQRAMADLMNYRNGGKCNYASDQVINTVSLNDLNNDSQASKYYQMISPNTYGFSGIITPNSTKDEIYNASYSAQYNFTGNSAYINIYNSLTPAFQQTINAYNNLIKSSVSL